ASLTTPESAPNRRCTALTWTPRWRASSMAASTMPIAMESSCMLHCLSHELADEDAVSVETHEVAARGRLAGSHQRLGRSESILLELVIYFLRAGRHVQRNQHSLIFTNAQIREHILVVLIDGNIAAVEKFFVGMAQLQELF